MDKDQAEKFLETFKAEREASMEKEAINPLENSHFVTLLESALKGLEYVGYATMDWKLLSIIEITRAYLKEKKEELKSSKDKNLSDTGWSGIYY